VAVSGDFSPPQVQQLVGSDLGSHVKSCIHSGIITQNAKMMVWQRTECDKDAGGTHKKMKTSTPILPSSNAISPPSSPGILSQANEGVNMDYFPAILRQNENETTIKSNKPRQRTLASPLQMQLQAQVTPSMIKFSPMYNSLPKNASPDHSLYATMSCSDAWQMASPGKLQGLALPQSVHQNVMEENTRQ